jgi:Zn-dependent M28 family amino/carboxypeptidase
MDYRPMLRLISVFLLVFSSCQDEKDFRNAERSVSIVEMGKHISVLASDEFQGRKPFTEGETKTIEYLKDVFISLGLEPAYKGSYFQPVPMVEVDIKPSDSLRVTTLRGAKNLILNEDFVVFSRRLTDRIEIDFSEVVFCGYGITAPEYQWDDYRDMDVRGKTIVVLVNDPGLVRMDKDLFRGNEMTYYGRWTYKYEEAARRGAQAVFIVHHDLGAGYPWSVVVSGASFPKLYLQDENNYANRCMAEGWLTREAAASLFELAGFQFDELEKQASQPGFKPLSLNANFAFSMDVSIRKNLSYNVMGMIPGSKYPDEGIVYSAHWDHFGIGPVIDGDSIYNGAVDNGTSIAWMIEIARAFKNLKKYPQRSVLFLAPTAEEQGLVGADYYVGNPVFDLSKTVANINNDLMLPLGRMKDLMITGFGQSELDEYAEEAASRQGRYVTPDPNPESGMFYRADHFSFAKAGVPALFARGNTHHTELGKERTALQEQDWIRTKYHKPQDEYDPEAWNLEGIADDARLAFRIGWRLANNRDFPSWKEGSEFKEIREKQLKSK